MSLKNNIIERLREIITSGKISKERVKEALKEIQAENMNEMSSKLTTPQFDEEDPSISIEDLYSFFSAGKKNAPLMINNITDGLIAVKVVLYFLGDDTIKGLETRESRLEFFMDIDPSSKKLLEKLYHHLEKICVE